jgi:hypothetical protein
LFAFIIHTEGRATAIALGAQLQNLTSLPYNNCISAKAHIIAISSAYYAGSECNEAQDHIIYNIGNSQRFHRAKAQHFIWFTSTFNHLDLRQGTTHCTKKAQHQSFHHIDGAKQRQGLVRKCTTFTRHVARRQQQQGLARKRTPFQRCIARLW